ncbi:MAG: aminotransferase class V-fold PLP-dependent enzyme [Acidimicrobiia bacterium]|nr:aminotransferase class V-fold PLP-dependent enzyme [Acidimicrobiia bacterium]
MWALDKDVTHLNHGGFGATPIPVLEEQQLWRDRLEANPTRFLTTELADRLAEVRQVLGSFVGADADGLILLHNATSGINAVVAHTDLAKGDRVVTTSHDYNACRGVLEYAADRAGAEVTVVEIPFPIPTPDIVVDRVLATIDDRTRLVMLDHVTSPTALVLPLDRLVPLVESMGVPVLIDGAHAPGMVPVDIAALKPSYYAANCHKWMCSPKGSAFLWVAPEHRESFSPSVISHGWNRGTGPRFRRLADWMGTDDPTAWLSIPRAIDVIGSTHPDEWKGVRSHNRELALEARRLLAAVLAIDEPAPEEMIGAMATVPLPDGSGPEPLLRPSDETPMSKRLFVEHGIVAPVSTWPRWPEQVIRISAQIYNDISEYERLAQVLPEMLSSIRQVP